MKKLSYIGLILGLAIVLLFSMAGVALADPPNEPPVWDDPDGDGNYDWVKYCSQASLDEWQDGRTDIESWHFILNQVDGTKPEVIHVVWDNGYEADVPLDKETKSVAHYNADANTIGAKVTEAYVIIDQYFLGNLVLSNVEPEVPVPELPPVVLLGIGLLGLGAYAGWRKRQVVFGTAHNS